MANRDLTPRQQKFALAIVEGFGQSEAYRKAYEAQNMTAAAVTVEASRLVRSPRVKARINELRETLQRSLGLSRGSLLFELDEVLDLARARKDCRSMIGAVLAKARIVGFLDAPAKPLSASERAAQDLFGDVSLAGRGE